MRQLLSLFAALLATSLLIGCSDTPEKSTGGGAKANPDGAKYLLATAPAGARGVMDVREKAKDNEEVVIVGRIGGGVDPWIKGKPAFSIVDSSLKACSEIEGDTCPTPWDYCCESDLPKKKVLVKFVDASGSMVSGDAKELLGLKELQTVTVQGKAKRDDAGNLTVLARGIFVNK
jgi:hypothetical protein